ncbi:trypsin-like serine protease [Amycolatopsis sp. H20-H5]|uniref:trypsin-like serine protease n=1 Tax=Amycolatopsis sp. H20-H5 TaxID=3046309 RepID=UPI002DB739D6|nr:trypsin-like serine protease [Amycolatopsis sp. H20-H5]MEC3981174.1 trypsin-like serine protease [Amycolatopsis sp. H20-H5]
MKRTQRVLGLFALSLAALSVPVLGDVAGAAEPANAQAVAPIGDAHIPGSTGAHSNFIGGEKASVKDYPFIIGGLRAGGPRPKGETCTGSVVAPRKIIIAAHCKAAEGTKTFLYGLDDLQVGTGTTVGVVSYVTHPKYVNFDQGYDVAVVTTDADIPVPAGGFAKIATTADTDLNKPGQDGLGLGYGKKDFNDDSKDVTLQKITLPIVNGTSQCTGVGAGFQDATMVCAGYSDGHKTILPGDSGGPLIVGGKIVGLASWSRSDFKWYSVYSRLNNDMGDWAVQQVGGDPQPSDSFTLAASPASVKVDPGKYVSATITSKAGKNGSENVALTASGLPDGAKATFQPSSINSGDTAKVTIETAANTPEKDYTVTISGKGTTDTATATLKLTVGKGGEPPVGDLTVAVTPGSGSSKPGFFTNATVSATGGTGTITLSASGSGLPIAPFFNPQTISTGGSSTMQIIAPFQAGTYPITVKATDSAGKTSTTTYTLTVQ